MFNSADIVITYVDNNDPEWHAIAARYKNVAQNVVRYRPYKTLKHQVKLMLKFMPFVKNIFVVVSQESQIPNELKDMPNVIFVTHSQIIPEKYLPVFNSCAIEMFLHKIPGLQEHFIYFNDDMFIVSHCEFEDFFKDEKPVISTKYSDLAEVKNMFGQQCVNSYWFACDGIGRHTDDEKFFKPAHCPSPMFKSDCEELYGKLEQYIFMSLSKTRHAKNLNQYMYVDYSVMKRSNVRQRKGFFRYLILGEQLDKGDMPCEICVNDMNKSISFEDDISKFKEQLAQLCCEQPSIAKEKSFSLSLEELFQYAYVISIDPERLSLMQKIFEHHGLPMPKLYEGFRLKHVRRHEIAPQVNCSYSHLALIKMAKMFDWPFICIFEDDAYPAYDIKEKLEYYLKDIPGECECLVLGNFKIKSQGAITDKLFKVSYIAGSHAYIVFKSGYDRLINAYNDIGLNADNLLACIKSCSPNYNLFIQHCCEKSMHGHSGYIWGKKTLEQIFKEFPKIETVLKTETLI